MFEAQVMRIVLGIEKDLCNLKGFDLRTLSPDLRRSIRQRWKQIVRGGYLQGLTWDKDLARDFCHRLADDLEKNDARLVWATRLRGVEEMYLSNPMALRAFVHGACGFDPAHAETMVFFYAIFAGPNAYFDLVNKRAALSYHGCMPWSWRQVCLRLPPELLTHNDIAKRAFEEWYVSQAHFLQRQDIQALIKEDA